MIYRRNIIIIGAYFILTVVMTWPTAIHLTDGIPGDGFDGWQNYWNIWWVKEALLVKQTHPYFTYILYPPDGTNLFFHTLNILNALWTLPIQLNGGLALAYNSVVFFSFVFSGYGVYLLALYTLSQFKRFSKNSLYPAAFVGGLVFTMAPFHMAHLLGHMQVFSMMWPPFYILWLLRTLQPWTNTRPIRYRWRNILSACFFLILATLIDWYHALYLILFTGYVVLWCMWRQWQASREHKTALNLQTLIRPIWPALAIGIGFAIFFVPLLIPMINEARARPDLQTGLAQNITLSADLLAFFTPSEMHPIWGDWATNLANNFTTTTSERLIFAGFTPLILGLFILLRYKGNLIVRFWTIAISTFFVLALGPFLHIAGQLIHIGPWPLPLPYLALYYTVPFIGLTRSLSRYDLMVMLGLGILVALALAEIQRMYTHTKKLRSIYIWPSLAAFLICFEFLAIPYPISLIQIPQFYDQLARDEANYNVAELPMNWDRPTPLLHQTVHGKSLLTAYTSRDHPRDLSKRIPVFQQWRFLEMDIIDQPLDIIAPTIFFDFNLRYIILDYWQMPPGPERERTEKWVSAAIPNIAPIYDDGRLKVFQTPSKVETETYLSLGDGWSVPAQDGNLISRTLVTTQPELFLHHPQNQSLTLEITAKAKEKSQTIDVLLGSESLTSFELSSETSTHQIELPASSGDLVKLTLMSSASDVSVYRLSIVR